MIMQRSASRPLVLLKQYSSSFPGFVFQLVISVALFQSSSSYAAAVGATPGRFDVDASGAANYSIPIEVPPGINGLQPNLSLGYSSRSGNGLVGMGWSLGGLSAIHRCPATYEPDGLNAGIGFGGSDRFCLDGKRLIAISGGYGAIGTEYRTEIESFSKINSIGTYFTVLTKSGQTLRYGYNPDSRIEATRRHPILSSTCI